MAKEVQFPSRLAYLGYISAGLMVVLYLGRLIVLGATSPAIVIPALLEGFIVNPLWYVWLGMTLMRSQSLSRSTVLIRS
jgi:hypothetical protein